MRRFLSVVVVMVCSVVVWGQTNRGGISGTVTDQNGAVVPGATVSITNLGTNQTQTMTTSESGSYAFNLLEPVYYSLQVEMKGFKKTLIGKTKVDTAMTTTINVTLETGTLDQLVTVTSEPLLINSESAAISQTVTQRQIQDVPLNNRSVLDLAVTIPNVAGEAGSEDPGVTSDQPVPGFNLSLNGGRPGSTTILADGIRNTGVGIARAVVSFTPETVQEFTVQTSAYSAEFGNTGGGVINATTKSGTNQLNGIALWYSRNPKFNARTYTTGTAPRPPNNLRYNQVSITVGGPVFLPKPGEGGKAYYDGRDKTFFFFAYEPRWRRDFLSVPTLLPTAAERSGDFTNLVRTSSGWVPTNIATQFNLSSIGPANIFQQFNLVNGRLVPLAQTCTTGGVTAALYCQFPGNRIPANMIDPKATELLKNMPPPGEYFIDAGFVRNYLVQRFVKQDETRYTLRLDHNVTKNDKVNFRYSKTPAVGIRGFGSDVNGNSGVYSDAQQYVFGNNHIFSASVINDLRIGYTRGVFSEDFSPEFSIKGGRNLSTELGLPSLTSGGLPLFQISGDGMYNAFADVGSSGSTNNFNVEQQLNMADTVLWTRGNMSWKFGVETNLSQLSVIPFFGASGGRWEFRTVNTSDNRGTGVANGGNNLASLLLGVPNAVQVRPLLLNYYYYWKSGAAFVQNDWRIKPNLTLNLGLRYSLQLPRAEKNNQQGVFRPDITQTQVLTDAQRRATATGLGIATTAPIPSYVPTSVTLPAFAFAGRGGRSKYLVPIDYMGFEPRFGFAWSPKFNKWLEDRFFVIRGGYGISHSPITGNNRLPSPDFGAFTAVSTTATGSTVGGTGDPLQPVRLNGNPPFISGGSIDGTLGTTADGLIYLNGLGTPGFAISPEGSGKVPYIQNWNLSLGLDWKGYAIEAAYVANKGTHLYMPLVNINPKDFSFVELLEAQNLNSETTFADPLGRRNVLGAVVAIQRNSVTAPYFGFNNLLRFFDPSANSIRHAGYISVQRRVSRGLTFTANYTFGKSLDDASDSSPDVRVLTSPTTLGQEVSYGVPRSRDRSFSTFDITHLFNSTAVWDVPIGKGRTFLTNAPSAVNALVGGWTLSGVFRMQGGQPAVPIITDTNRLGGTNRAIRLDIVPGVPLKNPLYSENCTVGGQCEPYLNLSAFMRPAKGSLGNAPRTIALRAPMQEFLDVSIQKNFNLPFGAEGRRRLQLRVDFINLLNHPNFRWFNTGNTPPGFGSVPNEALLAQADINTWNAFSPGRAATLTQVNNLLINARLASGAIPLDFFRVTIPQGFTTTNPNAFDITTLSGLKLYRLRQSLDTNFGTLVASTPYQPRYIQFGLKLYF
jgi:Carboxypeptidase regulatory-like domain